MAKKSVFLGYSELEVKRLEQSYYCIIMGDDFFIKNKRYVFTKPEATKIYRDTVNKLAELANDGTDKEKEYSLHLMGNMNIVPFKLH